MTKQDAIPTVDEWLANVQRTISEVDVLLTVAVELHSLAVQPKTQPVPKTRRRGSRRRNLAGIRAREAADEMAEWENR